MPCAVILTALRVEYLAVRKFLTDLHEEVHPQGMVYERGFFGDWQVRIAEVGAGNNISAVESERAIGYFEPDVLLFVGVAGGLKDDVKIGDVVAATKIYAYESGKVGDKDQFLTRPVVGNSSAQLVARARAEARKNDWRERLSSSEPLPEVFVGAIAAGEKVVAAQESQMFKFLRSNYNDALAVEMEGFGVLNAAFAYPSIQVIVIRGISDMVEGKNDPALGLEGDRQVKASNHAAAFAFELLAKFKPMQQENAKAKNPLRPVTPSAYDQHKWVGRDSLIKDICNDISIDHRLVVLVGITGIGKTALGERLVFEMSDWFSNDWSRFHQENFENEQQSSDFVSVASRWLGKWGEIVTQDSQKDPTLLMNRLIKHLCSNRYIIQMDSLEYILQGNEDKGWSGFNDEWWVRFFEAYLKSVSCESCIIMTSQDLPGQLREIGTRSRNFWDFYLLNGLNISERLDLFKQTGLKVKKSTQGLLERIGNAYEGHPLSLIIIAGEINSSPFYGDVTFYWENYRKEIEEVEKSISESQNGKNTGEDNLQIDRFTQTLRSNVRSRINTTLRRLKNDNLYAYILLCMTAIYRCPVPEEWWLDQLKYYVQDKEEQKNALNTLRERYLAEEVKINDDYRIFLRQHNLIRSASLECLKTMGNEMIKYSVEITI
jgi:nucleoside phosphorylase